MRTLWCLVPDAASAALIQDLSPCFQVRMEYFWEHVSRVLGTRYHQVHEEKAEETSLLKSHTQEEH